MKYDPDKHHRRLIRLKGYDYTLPGAYFVTICTQNRECLFGDIVGGEMNLNEYGQIVEEEWMRTPNVRQEIALDAFVIMPNHFHGVVFIESVKPIDSVRATGRSPLQTRFTGP